MCVRVLLLQALFSSVTLSSTAAREAVAHWACEEGNTTSYYSNPYISSVPLNSTAASNSTLGLCVGKKQLVVGARVVAPGLVLSLCLSTALLPATARWACDGETMTR